MPQGDGSSSDNVSIKTIARDLGVSHMTVSRALSQRSNVSPRTREAVQRRAEELGYVRSSPALVIRGNVTRFAGLLLPNITNEFYAIVANTFAEACQARDIQVGISLTGDDPVNEFVAIRRLREQRAAAIVMVPAPGSDESALSRVLAPLHVVQMIRHQSISGPCTTLSIAETDAIHEAVMLLAHQGRNRIAYIGGHNALSSGRDRCSAFIAAVEAAGCRVFPDLVCQTPPSFQAGQELMSKLMSRAEPPDALLAGGFELSNGALDRCLHDHYLSDGKIAFVGFGDTTLYRWAAGGITTIALPAREIALDAATYVAERIDGAPDCQSSQQPGYTAKLIQRASSK